MNNKYTNLYITICLLIMSVAVVWVNLATAPNITQPTIQYTTQHQQSVVDSEDYADEIDKIAEQGLDDFDYNISGEYKGEQPEISVEFPIDINTATKEQLDQIPGIGEKMAIKIIAYRSVNNGRISSIDSLDEIEGIGDKTVTKLKDYLYVK